MSILLYLDTSALAKLYVNEPETAQVEGWILEQGHPIVFNSLHELEIASLLERRCAAGDISRGAVRKVWRALEDDLDNGVLSRVKVDWTSIFDGAIKWVRRQTGGLRALDGLHLACALDLKSKTLVTFDQRQARAAARAGLETLGAKGLA